MPVYYYQGQAITDVKEWCRAHNEEVVIVQWRRSSPRLVPTDKGARMEMREWVEEEEIPAPIWQGISSSMNGDQLGLAKVIARYRP